MVNIGKGRKGLQLRATILRQIAQGALKPSQQIATERELSSMFKIGIRQVRKVLSALEEEGVLVRIQGKGTFVSSEGARGVTGTSNFERAFLVCGNGVYFNACLDLFRSKERTFPAAGGSFIFLCCDPRRAHDETMIREFLRGGTVKGVLYFSDGEVQLSPSFSGMVRSEVKVVTFSPAGSSGEIPSAGPASTSREEGAPPVGKKPAPSAIRIDEYRGMFEAVTLGFRNNHRRMSYVFRRNHTGLESERIKGLKEAYASRGLEADERSLAGVGPLDSLKEILEEMLASDEPPTLFIFSDAELALKALLFFFRRGIAVPERISVMAFEANREGADLSPAVTGISISIRDILETATGIVERQPGSAGAGATEIIVAPEIILRSSLKSLAP